MLRSMNKQARATIRSGQRIECPRCGEWRYMDEVELCQRCAKSNNPLPPRIRRRMRRYYSIKN